jgi:hypothetical protein
VLDPEMAAQLKVSNPQAIETSCSKHLTPSFSTLRVCPRLQAADTYVLDPEMAAQLKASNPQAS